MPDKETCLETTEDQYLTGSVGRSRVRSYLHTQASCLRSGFPTMSASLSHGVYAVVNDAIRSTTPFTAFSNGNPVNGLGKSGGPLTTA